MGRPSNIPPEQRTEVVLAVLRGTEKLEVLARRHQVSANTLRKWRDEFVAAGQERLSGRGGRGDRGESHAAAAQADNQRRQKELGERELIIGELTVTHVQAPALVAFTLQKKVDRSHGTMASATN